MIPSFSPGRARRAPSFRPFSWMTVSLMLAVGCSHSRTPKAVATGDARESVAEKAQAMPSPTIELLSREGGTGTRAKGEPGAKPASPAMQAPMGYGAGLALKGSGAGVLSAPTTAAGGGVVSRRALHGKPLLMAEPEADR